MAADSAKSRKKTLSLIIRIGIALVAIGLFLKGENLKELWGVLTSLNPWVFIAAAALYCGGQFLFVLRWRLLLKVLSIDISVWAGVKLHLLGLFYNNCLPSSVGGDLLRAWYVTKHAEDDRRFEAALSVFVDRAVGLSGMIMLACIFYWLVPVGDMIGQQQAEPTQPASSGGGIFHLLSTYRNEIGYLFAALAAASVVTVMIPKGRSVLLKVWTKLSAIASKVFVETFQAVKLYGNRPFTVAFAYLLTFICQGMTIFGMYLLGRNLGMTVAMKYYYVIFPMSWMIGVVPVSIGGLGVVEGFVKVAFESLPGCVEGGAAALAVCQRLVLFVGAFPGVFIHLLGFHVPAEDREFFIDSTESID